MRKLILTVTVAILTSGVSISAFANNNSNNNNSDEVIVMVMNDGFKQITLKDLPEAVTNAILKDYAGATITIAFVNDSEQYKIELTVEEAKSVVYADKEGNWLKEEDIEAKKVD